jgi:EAL domain-containing protein (putative c-di-GMP-specific phosphodiesterase class I)/FixJ family two-component response regulator
MEIADLHFLVAEDHEFQRRTLVIALKSLGAKHVLEAADGRAALDYFTDLSEPVDVIICDLEMPNMDGMEFIRHVGNAKTTVSLILTSGMERNVISSVETMTRAYGINLLGAIEKPATPQKLHDLIKRHGQNVPRAAKGPKIDIPEQEIIAGLKQGQFEPFFQPKVDLQTGKVVGAESLARWRHPQRGVLLPGEFIGLIEQQGLMDELTWVMLEKSASACVAWHREGWPLTVSVNLSLTSLEDPACADRITHTVEKQRLPPQHMVLEITESAAMTNVAPCLEALARLRMKGFGLSIDDYGTGYSSMQQLGRIPFTELKIDQSFVTDSTRDPQNRIILDSSISMARKLGLKTVAEGVETRGDWNLLQELGCSIAQGYFIAKPMSAAGFLEWMPGWAPPD